MTDPDTDYYAFLDEVPHEINKLQKNEAERRISQCIETLVSYMGCDGAHHKQFAIMQSLRDLLGPVLFAELIAQREATDRSIDEGIP
jgi:hypothetical protein